MIKTLSVIIVSLAISFFIYAIYYARLRNPEPHFSCTSEDVIIHGKQTLNGKFVFSMAGGNGTVRIIGVMTTDGKPYALSRQIHFTYTVQSSEYTLTSTQVVILSNDKGKPSGANNYYPPFFSFPSQKLTMQVLTDKYNNKVFYFGGVPLFYCVKNS